MRLAKEERGQTLVVVALVITMLFGFAGLALDVAWYGLNLVRMQRAADAAALAGVVYLPGNPSGAFTAALAAALYGQCPDEGLEPRERGRVLDVLQPCPNTQHRLRPERVLIYRGVSGGDRRRCGVDLRSDLLRDGAQDHVPIPAARDGRCLVWHYCHPDRHHGIQALGY